MDNVYGIMLQDAMIVLGVFLFVCLYRAVRGPSTADRVIAVNMTGTVTIMLIVLLSLKTGEGYLMDVALMYALLSFLAVVLLCRIFIGVRLAKKEKEAGKDA